MVQIADEDLDIDTDVVYDVIDLNRKGQMAALTNL